MARRSLKRSRPSDNEPETSLGETDVDQDVFSFVWTINNYSTLIELGKIKSPVFRGGPKNNYGWELRLNRKVMDEDEYLSLYLHLTDIGKEDPNNEDSVVRARCQLAILNFKERPFFQRGGPRSSICVFDKPQKKWGGSKFCNSTDLLNPESKLVIDDGVKIQCKIWIIGKTKRSLRSGSGANYHPSHEERARISKDGLVNDLGKGFRESIGTDVTISGSKTNFKAHKVILIARSTVFAAMFNADMLESHSNVVQIEDFEDEVVKGMLEHLYTGKTASMNELAAELLKIAEKYDMKGLKADCEYELVSKLNMQNAGELLVLAQTYNAPNLKTRTMDFINLNKDNLLKTKSFQDALKIADAGTLVELYLSQL